MTHHSAEWEHHPAPTLPLSSPENDRQAKQTAPLDPDRASPSTPTHTQRDRHQHLRKLPLLPRDKHQPPSCEGGWRVELGEAPVGMVPHKAGEILHGGEDHTRWQVGGTSPARCAKERCSRNTRIR